MINIILFLLLSLLTFTLSMLLDVNSLLYIGLYISLLSVLFFLIKRVNKFFNIKINFKYATYTYSIMNLFAIINSLFNKYSYGNYFGAYIDDSKYFYRALDISNNINIGPYSFYEYILSLCIKLFSSFSNNIVEMPIYLLVVNILFVSLSIAILSYFYFHFVNEKMPLKYLILFVLLNILFTRNSIYLYRESIAVLTFFLSILSYIKNKKVSFWLFLVITFSIRGAFGVLLLFLKVLELLFKRIKINKKIVVFVSIIGLGVAYLLFDYLTQYLSFYGNNTVSAYMGPVLSSRTNVRVENLGGIKGLLFSFAFIRPVVFLFSPISFAQLYSVQTIKQNISTWETIEFTSNIFDWLAPVSWFTTLFVAIMIPVILSGLINMYRSNNKENQIISIFYVFSWIAISLFSMQTRHMVVLVLFYPIFYAYQNKYGNKRNLILFRAATLFLVVIANLV